MNHSRDFARLQARRSPEERFVFVGTFRQHINMSLVLNGREHRRTMGMIFSHVWVCPRRPEQWPYIFSWFCPFYSTSVGYRIPYQSAVPQWTTEFYPHYEDPQYREPVTIDDSSDEEDEDLATEANRPPDYDYTEGSVVSDRDLEYGFEIVNLAENAPDVD